MKEKVATFLVPVLTVLILLYHALADLQIALTNPATVRVVAGALLLAALVGLAAAFSPQWLRIGLLVATMFVLVDAVFRVPLAIERLTPVRRAQIDRDQRRIADLKGIQRALEAHIQRFGTLPRPDEYGEATGPREFWFNHWDTSASDADGDGRAFLDFLIEIDGLPEVPVDPINQAEGDDPRAGSQYAYFLVGPEQRAVGGICGGHVSRWVYLLAVTDLESESARPPAGLPDSGCGCLWRDQPDFFEKQFDYLLCGTFEATPGDVLRAAAARRSARYGAKDRRRIADLATIKQALETYLQTVGPLPPPEQYGEAISSPGYWTTWWDGSAHDLNGDGRPFLDFLVSSGVLNTVPVDPDNQAPRDNPRSGRQYVYFLAPPDYAGVGGESCGRPRNQWVYMLAITDLESEVTRPPAITPGSGCDCLWRDLPNYFQRDFDFVTCGTFTR